jgi:protein-S-isoprenylcysteine O-methyltransferase Ste14
MDRKSSSQNRIQKIFGIGPTGAILSIFLLFFSLWADSTLPLPLTVDFAGLLKPVGIMLIILGLCLHFWSLLTLRTWWVDDKLCTGGPFRLFRHPMYAAWITFICPGIAVYLNSWPYLLWVVVLHLMWHALVKKEEVLMVDMFGDMYKDYAMRTGRFFPKIKGVGKK